MEQKEEKEVKEEEGAYMRWRTKEEQKEETKEEYKKEEQVEKENSVKNKDWRRKRRRRGSEKMWKTNAYE